MFYSFTKSAGEPLLEYQKHWDETHFDQADVYSRLRQHQYVHPRVGELRYAVMANTVYRPVVHRHLTALLPMEPGEIC
ncbi:MAG: hypothetical protein ACK4WM_10275 [Thermoflexales bacterium]